MKNLKIAISGYGSISSLGTCSESIWKKYLDNQHCFNKEKITNKEEWVAGLSSESKESISELIKEKKYQQLDPSVLYAIAASRIAVNQAGWNSEEEFGISIGSSRGATTSFEKYYSEFIEKSESTHFTCHYIRKHFQLGS